MHERVNSECLSLAFLLLLWSMAWGVSKAKSYRFLTQCSRLKKCYYSPPNLVKQQGKKGAFPQSHRKDSHILAEACLYLTGILILFVVVCFFFFISYYINMGIVSYWNMLCSIWINSTPAGMLHPFLPFAVSCILHKLYITHVFYQFIIIFLFQIPNNLVNIIGLSTGFCGTLLSIS